MSALLSNIFNLFESSKSDTGPRVVGIDIGSTSMKVVEMEERDGVLTLVTYGEIQLGPYAEAPLGKEVILDSKQEQSALIDLMRESAVRANNAVFAVPLTSSFVTVIKIPAAGKDDDISSQVRVQARKYIPLPINDVTLDWAEVARSEQGKDVDTQEVLLAAIQKEVLSRLRTLMRQTNFSRQPTEIECFSTIRALGSVSNQATAIIDIGGGSSKLYLTQNGLLEQLHRVRVGGSMATEKISQELSCNFFEAETKKRQFDPSTEEGQLISRVHNTTFDRALREFRKVIEENEKKYGDTVEAVVITGGVSLCQGFHAYAEQILNRKLIVAQPFKKVAYPAFMEDLVKEIGPSFSVALGAAMRMYQ